MFLEHASYATLIILLLHYYFMISIIYSPFPNLRTAKSIGRELVSRRLVACVNIIPSTSVYEWKGNIEDEKEYVMIAKTTTKKRRAVVDFLHSRHPYELPAILWWNTDTTSDFNDYVAMNTKVFSKRR